jgi:SAM-dependent methyltransferase
MINFLLEKMEATNSRTAIVVFTNIFFSISWIVLRLIPGKPRCPVCGALLATVYRPVLSRLLADQWNLNDDWANYLNRREGEICISCGSSVRVRQLAKTLALWVNKSFQAGICETSTGIRALPLENISIAEINSCGAMHKWISKFGNVSFSEYNSIDKNTRHEDILSLTYSSGLFDIVLHSDTLEHVPDVDRALTEIWRILKPGGASIFSIPIVRDGRPSIARVALQNGELYHYKLPSYHGGSYQTTRQYLVCYEFGEDFISRLKSHGFHVTLIEGAENPTAVSFIAEKPSLLSL